MKNGIRIVLVVTLSIVTLFFLAVTIQRLTWDYNENGIHFDEETATTYSEGAILVFGVLTVLSLLPTLVLLNCFRGKADRLA